MTLFEIAYRAAMPFLPPLNNLVRTRLRDLTAETAPQHLHLLDVGGRKSPYTIGIPASITISELPRVSEVQHQLHLGVTSGIAAKVLRRRSNIARFVFDDMTRSSLPDNSFDGAVAVEVLEHVAEDAAFLDNISRVLKPGGVFLMTTPNGDAMPVPTNPDHIRHYTRAQLFSLLAARFADVRVDYAVVAGYWRSRGLVGWSLRRPLSTIQSMIGNIVANRQAQQDDVAGRAYGTGHLIASATKPA